MTRRTLLLPVLGLAVFFLTAPRVLAAPLYEDETLKLASGRTVKVLSVAKVEYSKGVMALMIRYQTTLSVDERKDFSAEVDDVWKVAQKDVDRYGFDEAILSSNEVPKGIFITSSHMLDFIFEKGADGKWRRLNRADFMAAE